MTQDDLKTWISEKLGPGRWLTFVAYLNEARERKGVKPLTAQAVSNWLHTAGRKPPTWLDSYLPLIESRIKNPDAATVVTIHLALSQREYQALIRTAKRAGVTVEQFAEVCARIGFESECGR